MPGRSLLVAAIFAAALARVSVPAAAPGGGAIPCPAKPTPVIASAMPGDVCIPDGFTGVAVDYFDDYSWRAFTSLVWPAASGKRGVAAPGRISTAGARVFETFKPLWEIFHADGSAPEPSFGRYDAAAYSPCGVASRFGEVVIGSISGIDDIGQAGIGVLDPPIVAQNGRYVRTLTLFNQIAFDHIVKHRYYRRDALPVVPSPRPERPVLEFPIGSVAIKTAWIDVNGLAPVLVKRLYTRSALVKRAGAVSLSNREGCTTITVGLIGMHIAQKTVSRPQWIWSSFEQKELVPPKWADWPGAFVLHDGQRPGMPERNPLSLAPLAPEPAHPFNIERDAAAPILTATELTSFAYQEALKGTPWEYYRLIMTQWPRLEGNQTDPIPVSVDGSAPNTFPGTGAFSAFTNVAMETFDQKNVQLGCMSCHNRARMNADFMWTVMDHAYPSRLSPAPR